MIFFLSIFDLSNLVIGLLFLRREIFNIDILTLVKRVGKGLVGLVKVSPSNRRHKESSYAMV